MKRSMSLLRRSPMKRTSTLKRGAKRIKPRSKRNTGPSAAESRYMGAVAQLGCLVCRWLGHGDTPAEVHHQRSGQGRKRASHYRTMGLCFPHHRGAEGIHTLGTKAWQARYYDEADLVAETQAELAHLMPGATA